MATANIKAARVDPGALPATGDDLAGRDAHAVLPAAPSPDQNRRLTTARMITVLREAGRQRNQQATAERIVVALHTKQLTGRPSVVSSGAG